MFRSLAILLYFCLTAAAQTPIRISLAGNDWTVTDNINYTAQGTIPGTIHTILLAAHQIPDPYIGNNDVNLRYLVKTNWIFTKSFNLSSNVLASKDISIIIEQVDTVAIISINKCPIGQTTSMFVRYVFSIPVPCLRPTNEITFRFQSPINYAYNQSVTYNTVVAPLCTADVQNGECHVQFIRKEPCSFSWDWGPAFAPIGITRDIYIEASNSSDADILLESVNLINFDNTNQTWKVDVLLSSNGQFKNTLKFTLVNTTWSSEMNVTFVNSTTVSLFVSEGTVARWWPNGYGNQTLYELTVSMGDRMIDARILGFRTVELVQNAYEGGINGTSFYFMINSIPIFIKGSNWIPSDSFQERVSDQKLEQLLRSAQAANMNMLRVWGGGIYERQTFYQFADQLGIMLWHDFMFACSLYPVDQPFLDNVRDEVLHQVKRLQHHPSIVLWSGNNENEEAIAENWWHLSVDNITKAKDDYRTLYIHTVQDALKQVDTGSNRPFVPSSPSNGPLTITENYIATNPQDPLYGDVHFYGFNEDPWNYATYPIARFLSETGVQSLPSLDTWQEATTSSSDLNFNSSFLLHREHSANKLTDLLNYIELNLPLPITKDPLKSFTQMIYLSQIHQSMTLKTISDLCRVSSSKDMINPKTSKGHTMGLMYWQMNDIWQAPTWSTIEYNLKWKMGHYYARHMYSPIYLIAFLSPYLADITDENAHVTVSLVNEYSSGTNGIFVCGVYHLNSIDPLIMFAGDISMPSTGLITLADLPYASLMKRAACLNSSQCLIHCTYESEHPKVSQTLFLTRPKNYVLSNPNLQIQNLTKISPNGFTFVITVDAPALFIWLDVPSNTTGYFSRNGFHMFQRTMPISFHSWQPIDTLVLRPTFSLFDINQP